MMAGLYAAFWLQLDSPSSAAVTVGILALQTRGLVYQKAFYRILGTAIGVAASFLIAGSFPQSRALFLIGFAGWLGLCVYVGGLLDGNRASGAVLAGYTVALVAVPQIDSPQGVFSAGVNRGAAIVVGIAALALVNDVFAAPNVHTGLVDKLATAHRRVQAFVQAILRGESADPIKSANLLREITVLHPDITALAADSTNGEARGAAARSAVVALVAEVSAANALASLGATTSPSVFECLADDLDWESPAFQICLEHQSRDAHANPHDALFARHALDFLAEKRRVQIGIEDLKAGRRPSRLVHTPIYRSRRAALRNGLRAFLAVLVSAALFSLGGWPLASLGVGFIGLTVGLSAIAPTPRDFAASNIIAIPLSVLLAGATKFLILDGVDQFPLLAIGMAPVVVAAALVLTLPKPRLSSIAFLILIFFPLVLSPTNPPDYNPEHYLLPSFITTVSVVLLFVLLLTMLPTSDSLVRRWHLTSARAELRDLLETSRPRRADDEALFRDADRIGQLAALQSASGDDRRDDLRQALDLFGFAASVRRARATLDELSDHAGGWLTGDGYTALAACDSAGLRRAAADVANMALQLDDGGRTAARAASLSLIWAGFLIDRSPRPLALRRFATS